MFGNNNGNTTGMYMPVAPAYGGYGGGYGMDSLFGGGGLWALILILAIFNGGWGGFGGFGWGGMGMMDGMFPWLLASNANNQNATQDGFNQAATANALGTIQTSINTGFSNAEVAACNRAMQDQALSFNNQIADLNRSFDAQTAITGGQTALSSQVADCCCENRLAVQGLNATILSENCEDRRALSETEYRLTTLFNNGIQSLKDMACQDKIDAKNERIAALENQVNMQNLAASQAAQTAQLIADNTAQSQLLIQRIAPYPVPAVPFGGFYGGYGWGNGCGWGNNGFGFGG